MIDYSEFYQTIEYTPLKPWLDSLPSKIDTSLNVSQHGDLEKWWGILEKLPAIKPSSIDLTSSSVRIGEINDCDTETQHRLELLLRQYHPWRKGPYTVFGIFIDTEWRSDRKWNRLDQHIQPLQGRRVLDIGCGNGYHCWRMAGAGAQLVVGIDPTLLYIMQFQAIRHYVHYAPVHVLPLSTDDLPDELPFFDSVFSMGVLYHRGSPLDPLLQLRSFLRSGGELVLETLVIDGGAGQVLLPENRYAKMRNVWFIPSCLTLESWIKRCGYKDVRLIDVTETSIDEQRSTDWMTFQSLPDFLDPDNPTLTAEGLPAPKRAIFLATNP